ncbi:FAD6 [Scenedesmus sp. PABB004]|nr:FAD6 [Scenedesmus sp. PABB004]
MALAMASSRLPVRGASVRSPAPGSIKRSSLLPGRRVAAPRIVGQAAAVEVPVGQLPAAERAQLAEQWGYRTIGQELPDGVSLTDIVKSMPEDVFDLNMGKAWGAVVTTLVSVSASLYLISVSPWYLLPFAWFIAGTAFTGFFVIGHDCGHRSFSENKLLEDIVGTLAFMPLIYPFEPWRIKHNQHHAQTNKLVEDTAWHPVMPAEIEKWSPTQKAIYQTFLGSPLKLWASVGHWWIWHFDLAKYTEKQKPRVLVSLAAVAAFALIALPALGAATGVGGVVKYWLMPWLGYHFWMSTFTVVHHTAPHIPFKPAEEWNAAKAQLSGTVDCEYPRWVEFLCHDISVHVPHHVSSKIPWYNLRKANESLKANWGQYMTSCTFNWRMMKTIFTELHVYDKTKNYVPFDAAQPEPFFEVQRKGDKNDAVAAATDPERLSGHYPASGSIVNALLNNQAVALALGAALLAAAAVAPARAQGYANLIGLLPKDLKWGATGDFAGFNGLTLAQKTCADLLSPSHPLYASVDEYNAVMASIFGQAAKDLSATFDDLSAGHADVRGKGAARAARRAQRKRAGGTAAAAACSLSVPRVVQVAKTVVKYAKWKACFKPFLPSLRNAGQQATVAQAATDPMPDWDDDDSVWDELGFELRSAWKKVKRAGGSVLKVVKDPAIAIGRTLLQQLLLPLRQAGAAIKLTGDLTGQTALKSTGKFLRDRLDAPTDKAQEMVKDMEKNCPKVFAKFANGTDKVLFVSDKGQLLWGFFGTFLLLPSSYANCGLMEMLPEPGVETMDTLKARTAGMASKAAGFRAAAKPVADKTDQVMAALLTPTVDAWLALAEAVDAVQDKLQEALDFFKVIPTPIFDVIYGISDFFNSLPPCPDWFCGIIGVIGGVVDTLVDAAIELLGIPGVSSLVDLIRHAMEAIAPLPPWFTMANPFQLNLDVPELWNFLDPLEAQVVGAASTLIDNLTGMVDVLAIGNRTRVVELSCSSPQIRRRMSETNGDTIEFKCPAGWYIYVDSFTVSQAPDCSADYSAWLRTPCPAPTPTSTGCTVDWTTCGGGGGGAARCSRGGAAHPARRARRPDAAPTAPRPRSYNWKCRAVVPELPLGMQARTASATYDCVSPDGLASFKLLPELLSVTTTGGTALPNVTYSAGSHSLTVQNLGHFRSVLNTNKPGAGASLDSTAPTGEARAAPPYDGYSRGRLAFPLLLNTLRTMSVSASCSNAAVWINSQAQWPAAPVFNIDQAWGRYVGVAQGTEIREDMCGWRILAKRAFGAAAAADMRALMLGMTPKRLVPWSSPPSEQAFRDFWLTRGVCEHFTDGATRSHFAFPGARVSVPAGGAAACRDAVMGPSCTRWWPTNSQLVDDYYVVECTNGNADTQRGATWPLVGPSQDPMLSSNDAALKVCGSSYPRGPYSPYPCRNGEQPVNAIWCGRRQQYGEATYGSHLLYSYPSTSSTTLFNLPFLAVNEQWAAECSLEYWRQAEYLAKLRIANAHTNRGSTLATECAAKIAACHRSRGSCNLSDIFNCATNLGVVQYACVPESAADGSKTVSLVFRDSLSSATREVTCGASQVLSIASAELGARRSIRDVLTVVVEKMCQPDGRKCTLDVTHPALNASAGDALQVVSACVCVAGYEPVPVAGACKPCAAGTYRSNTGAECTLAPKGTFVADAGADAATPCPAGSFNDDEGRFACKLCPAGTFSAAVGATSSDTCQSCTATAGPQTYSDEGAASCSACPPGTALQVLATSTEGDNFTTVSTVSCQPCSPGSFRPAGGERCTLCDAGTFAALRGAAACTPAPAGFSAPAPGTITPSICIKGTWAAAGKVACMPCPDGKTTAGPGASSDATCSLDVISLSSVELAELDRLASVSADSGGARRRLQAAAWAAAPPAARRLLAAPASCVALAAKLERLGLGNATDILAEVGNSVCSNSWLNSPACAYDGGDCCPSTCQPVCAQVNGASATDPPAYVTLSRSCTSFACKDPAARGSTARLTLQCEGARLGANTPMQQLSQPLVVGQTVSAEAVALNVAQPESVGDNGTPGVCDPARNTAALGYDGGDCCVQSCVPNPAVATSCSSFGCLDPRYKDAAPGAEPPPDTADTRPPVISVPTDLVLACGSTLPSSEGAAYAFDDVDGVIALGAPAVAPSDVAPGAALTCRPDVYRVTLTWSARDKAGNAASASQVIVVSARQDCAGVPAAPANARAYTCATNLPGTVCNTTCAAGYALKNGSLSSTCRSGTWSAVDGVCAVMDCAGVDLPAVPANAKPLVCSSSSAGTTCTAECLDGYEASGNDLATVCWKGAWTSIVGKCLEQGARGATRAGAGNGAGARSPPAAHAACPAPARAPDCQNAVVPVVQNTTGFDCTKRAVNSTCASTCSPGYELAWGNLTSTCARGAWSAVSGECREKGERTDLRAAAPAGPRSAGRPPLTALLPAHACCRARDAGCVGLPKPSVTDASAFTCSGAGVGATCSATCDAGFALTSGTLSSVCREGAWGTPTGACSERNCSTQPDTPANAAPFSCSTAARSTCTSRCSDGVSGQRLGALRAGAPPGPARAPPPAAPPPPPPPPPPPQYVLTTGELTTTCSRGNWSYVTGVCSEKPCNGSFDAPANTVGFDKCGLTASGDTCRGACADGFGLTKGSLAATCDKGVWGRVTAVCGPLPCTVNPTAPVGARAFACSPPVASGAPACTTTCRPGWVLAWGALESSCVRGEWSEVTGVCGRSLLPAGVAAPVAAKRPTLLRTHGDVRVDDYYWLRDDARADPAVLAHLEAENAYAAAAMADSEGLQEELFAELKARIQQADASVATREGGYFYWSRIGQGQSYYAHVRAALPPGAGPPSEADAPPAGAAEEVVLDENTRAAASKFYMARVHGHRRRPRGRGGGGRGARGRGARAGALSAAGGERSVVWAGDSTHLFYVLKDHLDRPFKVMRHDLTGAEPDDAVVFEERDEVRGPAPAAASGGRRGGAAEPPPQARARSRAGRAAEAAAARPGTAPPRRGACQAYYVDVTRSESGKLVLIGSSSAVTNETLALPADAPLSTPAPLIRRVQDVEYCARHHPGPAAAAAGDGGGDGGAGGWLVLLHRDAERPNAELRVAPLSDPSRQTVLLPHRPDVKLEAVSLRSRWLVVTQRAGALESLVAYRLPASGAMPSAPLGRGKALSFDEPAYSISGELTGEWDSEVLRISYSSLTTPTTIFDQHLGTGRRVLKREAAVLGGFDRSNYETRRLWATARDGARVPVSLVFRRDAARLDGTDPLLLHGYGAYGVSYDASFSRNELSLLDRGWTVAIAHVRGGGDKGRRWYEGGKFLKKTNTFTDLIAAAEHLERYTRPDRLAIEGRSAGGLLMGAVTNMRPGETGPPRRSTAALARGPRVAALARARCRAHLFNAVIAGVPFVDVLTTMLDPSIPLTVTEYEEWGNPAELEYYNYMKAYSPVDNVARQAYPHMLVTAGLFDPRVAYWEPAKFVAKIRERALPPANETQPRLLVFKCEMGAGHFSVTGRFERLRDQAHEFAFLLKTAPRRA